MKRVNIDSDATDNKMLPDKIEKISLDDAYSLLTDKSKTEKVKDIILDFELPYSEFIRLLRLKYLHIRRLICDEWQNYLKMTLYDFVWIECNRYIEEFIINNSIDSQCPSLDIKQIKIKDFVKEYPYLPLLFLNKSYFSQASNYSELQQCLHEDSIDEVYKHDILLSYLKPVKDSTDWMPPSFYILPEHKKNCMIDVPDLYEYYDKDKMKKLLGAYVFYKIKMWHEAYSRYGLDHDAINFKIVENLINPKISLQDEDNNYKLFPLPIIYDKKGNKIGYSESDLIVPSYTYKILADVNNEYAYDKYVKFNSMEQYNYYSDINTLRYIDEIERKLDVKIDKKIKPLLRYDIRYTAMYFETATRKRSKYIKSVSITRADKNFGTYVFSDIMKSEYPLYKSPRPLGVQRLIQLYKVISNTISYPQKDTIFESKKQAIDFVYDVNEFFRIVFYYTPKLMPKIDFLKCNDKIVYVNHQIFTKLYFNKIDFQKPQLYL